MSGARDDRYELGSLLRDSRLFDVLMENIPDAIYFKDRESRFLRISRSLARVLGVDAPSQAVGRTDADFFAENHAAAALADERQVMRTGIPLVDIEEKESYRNRQDTWVLTSKMPLRDAEDAIIGTFGISHDITHRKQLEDRNQQLATLVENADDAIVGMDMSRRVVVWNKGAETVYGWKADDIAGKPVDILVPPDAMEAARTNWERAAHGEAVSHFETVRVRRDGARILVSLSLCAIRDATGVIVGMASIGRDITEQKAIQERIENARRIEGLAILAGGVAHQFNNINTTVKACLDMLQSEKGVPDRLMTFVERAARGVQRSVEITDRLLALTEPVGAGTRTTRLDFLARRACALHRARAERAGVRMVEDIAACPSVRGDETRLAFVAASLVVNALDALENQPLRAVTVRTGVREEGSFLEVEDTGCGIPEADMPRIFTPFFSSKGEWAQPGSPQAGVRGVGLSLAISNMTVLEYGGRMDVRSAPGAGSAFTVVMPVDRVSPYDAGPRP
jgi:two-component system, sensor histidine kinase and response regulator